MIYKIPVTVLLFGHAVLAVLLIFGLVFGVGLGEVTRQSARHSAIACTACALGFASIGTLVMFRPNWGFRVSALLFGALAIYFLWRNIETAWAYPFIWACTLIEAMGAAWAALGWNKGV